MPLETLLRRIDDATIVVLMSGPLTLGTNLKTADSQLQSLLETGTSRLILDLTQVPYADSAGLGTLVHTFGLAESRGGLLRLCGLSPRLLKMLQMTKTDALLPIDSDATASLAALPPHSA